MLVAVNPLSGATASFGKPSWRWLAAATGGTMRHGNIIIWLAALASSWQAGLGAMFAGGALFAAYH